MKREQFLKAFQLAASAAAGLYAYLWLTDPERMAKKK